MSIAGACLKVFIHCFLCSISLGLPPFHWHQWKSGYAVAERSTSNCVSQHMALFFAQNVAKLLTVLSLFLFVFHIIEEKLQYNSRLINRLIWELFCLCRNQTLVPLKGIFMCLADKLPDFSSSFLEGWAGKLVLQKCWGKGDSSTQF